MQVNVVRGDKDIFNTLLYNTVDSNTLNWVNNTIASAATALQGVATSVIDTATVLYNKVNSDAAIYAAKAAVANMGTSVSDHTIYSMGYEDLPNANYIMQQYIMASPDVQELQSQNLCYGYEDTYYDTEPDTVGTDRYDYQRVMNGVVQTGEDDVAFIQYFSNEDEQEISVGEQFNILDTWKQVKYDILCGVDPTAPDGAVL